MYVFQNGIPWHLGAFEELITDALGENYVKTLIHAVILDKNTCKDSDTVVALIMASLKIFQEARVDSGIADVSKPTEVWLKSDNAANYHSLKSIISTWSQRDSIPGLRICGWIFSEPGRGKSIPDQVSWFITVGNMCD